MANPQPFSSTCSCQLFCGTLPAGGGGNLKPGGKTKLISIITGTGWLLFFAVVNESCMSTFICGHDELSTWPSKFLVPACILPYVVSIVLTTSQFTFGVFFGTRP